MRTVTTNFRDAIVNGEDQVALVDFGDWTTSVTSAWWFDETDIAMDGGIRLGDNFCTDENLTLGTACNSIEISVLNQYTLPTFSEFQVFIGAATSSYTASTTKDAYANVDGDIVEVRTASASPYLYLNNTATTAQPSAGCKALEILRTSTDNQYIVLTIKEDNTAEAFTLDTSAHTLVAYSGTYSTPTFFQEKWASWDGVAVVRGIAYYTNYYTKFRNRDGNVTGERYELCSLGYFIPSTTHITNEEVITIQGYDRMTLFDKDASVFLANRNPYHNLQELFGDLCGYVGVTGDYTYALSGNKTFVPTIEGGSSYSLRQVLGAIAEALGCIAKFNNKGELKLYWFYTNNTDDIDYNFQRTVYNYSVSVIDKVQIGSEFYGSGDNVYYNDTNFLGLGATQVQNLYTRLNGFAAYSPCNASIFGTPSIEAGDIVVVKNDSLDVGVTVPIFVNNYAWNGSGSATIESTGDETRPIDSDLERQLAETVTGDDLATSGKVEISGDNITAGIIASHDGSTYFDLDNDEFVIENTKTYLQSNYSASDVTRIQDIILGNVTMTQADLDKYDWLGKGYLDVTDGLRVNKLVGGTYGASVDVINTIRLSAADKEMLIKAAYQVGSGAEKVMMKVGGYGLFAEELRANSVTLPALGSSDTKLIVQNTSGDESLTLGVDSNNGVLTLNGQITVKDSSGNTVLEQTTANSGGRIRSYQANTLGASYGANNIRGGFLFLYNLSGNETIRLSGEQGSVKCVPQDVKSLFGSLSNLTNCTGSITDAYYSAGFCSVRVSLTTTASIASNSSFTATVTFPSGYTPLMISYSASQYQGRAVTGTLGTGGTITFNNCGSSAIASGHTVAMSFVYPCS